MSFTPKFGGDWSPLNHSKEKLKAFTLAEVLITLAIIGVVAALTVPSVVTNYQKKQYVTKLKKSYSNIQNAFRMTMAKDGVTKLTDTKIWSGFPKGATTCNPDCLSKFSEVFNYVDIIDKPKGVDHYYYLVLADGTMINFERFRNGGRAPGGVDVKCGRGSKDYCKSLSEFQTYYNTSSKLWQIASPTVRIDINGKKRPNKDGRDIFYFILGNDGNLYPACGFEEAAADNLGTHISRQGKYWKDGGACGCYYNKKDQTSGAATDSMYQWGCAARIIEEGWKMNY